MQITPPPGPSLPDAKPHPDPALAARRSALMEKARTLEAAFLAEMLAHAGLGEGQGSPFGGGIGEDQFASFLRQEQATLLVARGGIGLAEHLFRAMTAGEAA